MGPTAKRRERSLLVKVKGGDGQRRPPYKGRKGRGPLLRGREGRREGIEREGDGIAPFPKSR